jgi:hypothetical protein
MMTGGSEPLPTGAVMVRPPGRPVNFSSTLLSGLLLWPGRVRRAFSPLALVTAGAVFGSGLWLAGVLGLQVPVDGFDVPRPAGAGR